MSDDTEGRCGATAAVMKSTKTKPPGPLSGKHSLKTFTLKANQTVASANTEVAVQCVTRPSTKFS